MIEQKLDDDKKNKEKKQEFSTFEKIYIALEINHPKLGRNFAVAIIICIIFMWMGIGLIWSLSETSPE